MKLLALSDFLSVLDAYIADEGKFDAIRRFVFQYYESEKDLDLGAELQHVFDVVAPYLEYEQAFGDDRRRDRMRRLRRALTRSGALAERSVFGLEFETIQDLRKDLGKGRIPRSVYDERIRKLSPATFDAQRVSLWAAAHEGLEQLDVSRMS